MSATQFAQLSLGVSLPQPSLPPLDEPLSYLEAMLTEVRTAGLRKGRETALVNLLAETVRSVKQFGASYGDAQKDMTVFAESQMSRANHVGKRWHAADSRYRESELQIEQARERWEAEVEGAGRERDAAALKLQEATHTHKETLTAREREWKEVAASQVKAAKQRWAKEFEKRAAKCVESVEGEYRAKMNTLKADLEKEREQTKTCAAHANDLEAELERTRAELERSEAFRKEMEGEYESATRHNERLLQSAQDESEALLKANNDLRAQAAVTQEACDKEVAETKNKRARDLMAVEERVKEVVKKKEQWGQSMLARAEKAEVRVREMEKVLNALNDGFELVDEAAADRD
ncbi:hypothetical protein TeGR_g5289 [Tetraparma gracilis]|uniref:Uncharacterized protein n=1 Tax=Tetraparma gracilis TaxID=2962635 RepID=A0ABQ6M9W6_9STRA|nr:hypothetical protein TeGR_g5289 [Tetraparma gracilis]